MSKLKRCQRRTALSLVLTTKLNCIARNLDESGTRQLIDAIEKIRVLDPACGSGAIPMGMLHRLVHLLEKLDPKNRRWKEQQKKRALRDLTRAEEMEDPENREAAKRNVAARLDDIAT
jgi:hypothetical protein